jgi:hypothetical protein
VSTSPVAHEITQLLSTSLITAEQSRALTTATSALGLMSTVQKLTGGKQPGQRHFNRIDVLVQARLPSPIGEARRVLAAMADSWAGLSARFHTYRQKYFDAQLRRAKVNKKMHQATESAAPGPDGAAGLSADDLAILQAEIQLEAAEIDALEAEVAQGQAELTTAVKVVTAKGEQYAAIVRANGGREFTESDFREEEISYYLTSAWWAAAESFEQVDARDQWDREEAAASIEDQMDRAVLSPRAGVWRRTMQEQQNSRVELKHEVLLYFKGLGIEQMEVHADLKALADMRFNYEISLGPKVRSDFTAHFEGWVRRMVDKYRARAIQAIAQHGFERVQAIQGIIDPPTDGGDRLGDVGMIKRRSVTG